jgi:hypothetical protein
MSRTIIGKTPYPLVIIDTDESIKIERIKAVLKNTSEGVSICVRSLNGHPKRGGYFFHIQKIKREYDKAILKTFDNKTVGTLTLEVITRLINHASGIKFDDEMFIFCQNNINFKQDADEND